MIRKWLLCCLLWSASLFVYADNQALLAKTEALRLSDPSTAMGLLSEVDQNSLNQAERLRYRYLEAYLSTFNGDLDHTLAMYSALLEDVPESALRIRVLTSMLGVASYKKNWRQSFELAGSLDDLLEQVRAPELQPEAYKGLLVFYNNVEQQDIALVYASRILNHTLATKESKCFALTMRNEINLKRQAVNENAFYDAISLCESAKQPYYVTFNNVHLFEFYLEQQELDKAQIIAQDALRKVNSVDFIYLRSSFIAAYARLKAAMGDTEEARKLALDVLQLDKAEQFQESLIDAYQLLSTLEADAGNFAQAYAYLTTLNRLEASFHSEQVAKSLALQQARFDLKNKESQIELLDKKNQLLSTESELVQEQVQSMIMALGLAVFAVIALLFWSYRTRRLQNRLRHLATTDALTGVYNRGHFAERSQQLISKASDNSQPISLIFFDLDHFKRINDTHGHQIGDWVLCEVVKTIEQCCIANKHLVGRIGGEEFGILMDNTDQSTALAFAERCREAINTIDTHFSGFNFNISASFGVSDTRQVGYNLDNLFSASDLALYQSKKYGRNQVCGYDGSASDL